VGHDVADGSLDDADGDRPPGLQGPVMAQERGMTGQVKVPGAVVAEDIRHLGTAALPARRSPWCSSVPL
jgi:hypothetical protein